MRHRTIARVALPAAALGLLLGLAPSAGAAPVTTADGTDAAGSSSSSAIAAHEMGVSDELAAAARRTSPEQAVRDYWTPARMRAAQPVEAPAYTVADLRRAAEEVETIPQRQVTAPVAASGASQRAATPFSYVAGKVFFSNSQGNYICSAAAVNSKSKSVVSTAGHCLHGGGSTGEWATNWAFVPGYNKGKAPKGIFAATNGFAMQDWVTNGASPAGFNRDFAFARLGKNKAKQTVVGAVGGNGVTVGGEYGLNLRVFGYPGNIQQGEVQKTCTKKSQKFDWEGFSYRAVAGCGFGGGSSGGPWVTAYNAKKDVGQLRGITSFGPQDSSFIASPYFDKNVPNLLKAADKG